MIINKIICDRCGVEIKGDAHPPRVLVQSYVVSTRATDPSKYKNDEKLNFCKECLKDFKGFLKNER